jgi:hypothetical protein
VRRSESLEPSLSHAHELLGVAAHVDAAELARAYRRQARRLHPDISLEADATQQFWTLQAAYQVALAAVERDAPRASAEVVQQVPTVVLGVPTIGVPATWSGRRGVAWLAAGPVRVQPPQRPTPGARYSEGGP